MQDIDQLRTRSVAETAELLGVSRDTVNTLLRRRELGSYKIGVRRVIGDGHIQEYLAEHELGVQ